MTPAAPNPAFSFGVTGRLAAIGGSPPGAQGGLASAFRSPRQPHTPQPGQPSRARLWRWIAAAATLVALGLAARFVPVAAVVAGVQTYADSFGAIAPAGYILIYAVLGVLLVPAWILTFSAGGVFGPVVGFFAAWLGATAGATLAFLIARYFARAQVKALVSRHDKFDAIDRAVRERGWKIVVLLRLSPLVPYNLLNYALGITGVRLRHFVAATAAGMAPGAAVGAYIGHLMAEAALADDGIPDRPVWNWVLVAAGLVVTVIATVYIARVARRAIEGDTPRRAHAADGEAAS